MLRLLPRLAVAFALTSAGAVSAQTDRPAAGANGGDQGRVATVNGKEIPKARADILVREQTQKGMPDSPQLRDAVRDELINREVLFQEAERRGIAKSPEVREQIELARQAVVIRALLSDWQKSYPVTDDALKAEYEKLKSTMPSNEYKARHILVETEDEAKDVVAKLKKGGKFEDLAKASKDPGSKDKGGDLGWSVATTFVKPFGDALAKLEKGKITEAPVQTQYGWHVIRLDDVRATTPPSLEQIRPQLAQRLQAQQFEKLRQDLRTKSKVQ
jgi:peptidyl-prolyl cis-trans isomerase C